MKELGKFQYYLPVNLIFGRRRLSEAGSIVSSYGKKVLLVTGQGSARRTGLLDRMKGLLEEAGTECVIFDQVMQNPLTATAEAGAALALSRGCQVVVGLGGGSIMDCAKAIAFLAVNKGDINDYIFNRIAGKTALPLVLIPTTCGTGSEGNSFAVLTNPENGDKKSLRSNAVIAKASIIDSELMETMPQSVLASVGFDALCHSMEAFLSKAAQPLTDGMCMDAIGRIGRHLPVLYRGEGGPEDWDAVAWASTLGGMAINTAGVALPHGMEHPASGLRNIIHGKGLAALTPVITEASIEAAPEKYRQISQLLGGRDETDCADVIRRLLEELDLSAGLKSLGIQEEDIPWMTKNCFKVSAASIANHPKTFGEEEIEKIYRRAM